MADEWYYTRNGERMGPVTTSQLRTEAASGRVQPTDLVWTDGMPQWIPASAAREIFPDPTSAALDPPLGRPAPPEPPTQRSHHRPGARPPRRRARASGLSTGALIAIIGSVSALVILVVIAIVILIVTSERRAPISGSYSVHLFPGGTDSRPVYFSAGKRATINVSTDRGLNVDLMVYDSRNNLVASDIRQARERFVEFMPPRSETYRIEVVNRDRGNLPGPDRSQVSYRQP